MGASCPRAAFYRHGTPTREGRPVSTGSLLFIFNAVQTLTVAAAGVLLGTSVQQARVASGKARADAALTTAKEVQGDAAKAQAARKLIESLEPPGKGPSSDTAMAHLRAIIS